jgi:hypothetical protein
LVVGLISLNNRDAAAQPSAGDLAAAGALLATPVGGLAPIMVAPGTKGDKPFNSVAGRFSRYSETGIDMNSFGGSFYHKAGMNAAVSGTVGYSKVSDCTACDGLVMLGGDVHSSLWNSTGNSTTATSINLQGSLGWGHSTDYTALSFAVGVPFAVSMEQSNKARISAFVTPGFGWGRESVTGFTAESGTRPLIGAGAAWTSPAGWGLHASFNKVIIEDGGNSIGVGFSYKLGK